MQALDILAAYFLQYERRGLEILTAYFTSYYNFQVSGLYSSELPVG